MRFTMKRIVVKPDNLFESYIMSRTRRFAALSRQVWHLVAQTPLVRGLPPNTPRKYVSW